MKYWLMKSEPDVYGIDHLKKEGTTWWECVRNYQARNYMMNEMMPGDLVLFYHSSAEPPGVAGLAVVSKSAQPDKTQFDKKGEYYDAKATKEKPTWYCVEIKFKEKFKKFVSLDQLKSEKSLKDMIVIQKGMRPSVQPVSEQEFATVCKLGGAK
jgi:predicted RNA-binding protein with PUA-like domain